MTGSAAAAFGVSWKAAGPRAAIHLHATPCPRLAATLCSSSSESQLHRRALIIRKGNGSVYTPKLRYSTKAAAEQQAVPFRRRGRRHREKLLDNAEGDQAVASLNKKQQRSQVLQGPAQRSQPDRRQAFTSPTQDSQAASTAQNTAEEGVGWGEGREPDDWGWGLDNPTLAAATGSYESELQQKYSNTGNSYSHPSFTPNTDAGHNWDDTELEEDWDDEVAAADDDMPDPSPDVTVLSSSEAEQLLKVVPQKHQVQYYGGTPVDLGVRVGTGLVLTIAASKLPLLAAGTLCYPLWWPVYKAWWQNQKLRSQYKYVGLWQTNVLSLDLAADPGAFRQEVSKPVIKFVFGDDSNARTQVDVPYNQRYEDVRAGESAELLLLSNTPDFSAFKALKEVYLPESGVWIAQYPFVDRDVFLDISLDIARERQSQQAARWPS